MQIVNFSHPLTDEQLDQIAQANGTERDAISVQDVKVQLDQQAAFGPQVAAILEQVHVREYDVRLYVVLPGLSVPAVLLTQALKECGKVVIIRLKPKTGVVTTGFDFAEFIV